MHSDQKQTDKVLKTRAKSHVHSNGVPKNLHWDPQMKLKFHLFSRDEKSEMLQHEHTIQIGNLLYLLFPPP